MTNSRNIVITVALDSFKSDKQVLMHYHSGPSFKGLNVSYFNKGMGSKGRGVAGTSHQLYWNTKFLSS